MKMVNTKEMQRISLYISKDLVKEMQAIASRDRRSVSFWATEILQKAVNRKNAKKGCL